MSQYTLFTGPILAGTQFNWALLGILSLQVYNFQLKFPNERKGIKALVYTIFLLDVVQTAISSLFAFETLVLHWGDPNILLHLPWSSAAGPFFTATISAAVQIFFAWRIYALKGKNPFAVGIAGLIVMLALMQSLCAIITDAKFTVATDLAEIERLVIGVKVWLIGSAVCDIVITATMLVILSQYRQNTPWSRTDTLITKLIYNVVETGAVTSIAALLDVVLFILYPGNNLHQVFAFMLGKIYSNVLVATLNARGRTADPNSIPQHIVTTSEHHELEWRRYGNTSAATEQVRSQKVHIPSSRTPPGTINERDSKTYPSLVE
ncbi:hypothetical protein B0H16DRAFT_863869 [Mycena metata]|uniref:DUF6534 domain-containing protein n=1 Tax=Mycena metata TaxID=1033252 RepID=A0AAD7IT52_9AGAR|nr:hypothetical protein B0H16DRAFT_873108 [Mycena metata]KAJ7749972.1 hypothetical protein B0H16DRAFT_863869 [Mycena metata]